MIINIKPSEVLKAKKDIKEFDEVKTYNKFKCNNNYIGLLGEIVFDRYLTELNVKHAWVPFIKENMDMYKKNIFDYPDFYIEGVTVDLKTTRSKSMWFQKPKHDIYIHAKIDMFNTTLTIDSYATKEDMEHAIMVGIADEVKRGNRVDYVLSRENMTDIRYLMEDRK